MTGDGIYSAGGEVLFHFNFAETLYSSTTIG